MLKRFLVILAIFCAAFLVGGWSDDPKTVPECIGEGCRDDVTHQMHPGSPAWCQNKAANGYKANCNCKRSCDKNDRGSDCTTYCRTPKCKCDHGCPMT